MAENYVKDLNYTPTSSIRNSSHTMERLPMTTNASVSSIPTATTGKGIDDVIIWMLVMMVIIIIVLVQAIVLFYIRKRRNLSNTQRLATGSPDSHINQTRREQPVLDVPLSTHDVTNSGVTTRSDNSLRDFKTEIVTETNSKLKLNVISGLTNYTKPKSSVPQLEPKRALIPKCCNSTLTKTVPAVLSEGQRLATGCPNPHTYQNGRGQPVLNLPLSTHDVTNSGVTARSDNIFRDFNPDIATEIKSKLKLNVISGLTNYTKPKSSVPQSEPQKAMIPKCWNSTMTKPVPAILSEGQRLATRSPGPHTYQNGRGQTVLDVHVPLSTHSVTTSGVTTCSDHNFKDLNPDSSTEINSKLKLNVPSGLTNYTKPKGSVPQSESKKALIPQDWNSILTKPSPAIVSSPGVQCLSDAIKSSPSSTKKLQIQDVDENPYYISVFPEPAYPSPSDYVVMELMNQGLQRQESTLSDDYYNMTDDYYQNVDVKLTDDL